ncbi:MAG: hypothetical protein IID37_15085 [Planctomycetes bacterium]|nr:hypothetical protein [Planctomycetota bacterium]
MTSIFKVMAVVAVVGVLCVGAVALATDFAWDANTANTNWRTVNNWDLDSSFPQNDTDNADITSGGNTCTLNDTGALVVNRITLGGASPTKRKLHIKNGVLVADELLLQDYADVDVDQSFTILEDTQISDNVWIDVANGVAFQLATVTQDHPALRVKSAQAVLNLKTTGTGVFKVEGILVDADAANASRGLKLDGGTLTLGSFSEIELKSDPDTDNQRAKFWLATGSIAAEDFGTYVEMEGGGSIDTGAELDLDQDLAMGTNATYPGFIVIEGYASIDIAANKKFTAPTLTIGDAAGMLAAVVDLRAASGAAIEIGF